MSSLTLAVEQVQRAFSESLHVEAEELAREVRRLAREYSTPGKKGRRITLRLSPQLKELIVQFAREEGLSYLQAGKVLADEVQNLLQISGRRTQPQVQLSRFGRRFIVTNL